VRHDPHLFTVFANGRQGILRNIIWFFIVADRLARDAQDASGRTVVERERPQQAVRTVREPAAKRSRKIVKLPKDAPRKR